jgi:hypothetical protein
VEERRTRSKKDARKRSGEGLKRRGIWEKDKPGSEKG